jgi:hypothetical protein
MIDVTTDPCAAVESGWAISESLRPNPLTPAVARRLARALCRDGRVCPTVADSVEMATGELVSLSVQQARSPMTLTIVIDRGEIAIEVRDGGQRLPTEGLGARGGRQVDAIDRLADSWGFDRLGAGRRLWALVTANPRSASRDSAHPLVRPVASP